jgi:hypothetical protein
MKVMSLFDGMSCGQIALKKLGAKFETSRKVKSNSRYFK